MYKHKEMTPLQKRIDNKTRKGGPDDCWIWVGCKSTDGYGKIKVNRKVRYVHRVVYELARGYKISEGRQINHNCGTRDCINPRHLENVTVQENIEDRWARIPTRSKI